MRKLIFLFIILLGCFSSMLSQADQLGQNIEQSLIKFTYKNVAGKETTQVYGSAEDLPSELKSIKTSCWWDALGWYNCTPQDKNLRIHQQP